MSMSSWQENTQLLERSSRDWFFSGILELIHNGIVQQPITTILKNDYELWILGLKKQPNGRNIKQSAMDNTKNLLGALL